jgi:hypothetical protein
MTAQIKQTLSALFTLTLSTMFALLAVVATLTPSQALIPPPPLPPVSAASYTWVKSSNLSGCGLYSAHSGEYYTDSRIWPSVYCQLRR